MAKIPPTKDERDANLDALKTAIDFYTESELNRLDNEVKFMRSVLEGRDISDTGTKNLDEVSDLVVSEIDDFLLFE